MDARRDGRQPPVPIWLEVRDPDSGKLLCKYDPQRQLLEFVRRRVRTVVDLKRFHKVATAARERYEGDNDG